MMWLRVFEVWATTRLLNSPLFHRGVRVVHRKVWEAKNGKSENDEIRGTIMEGSEGGFDFKKFAKHFVDEIKDQAKGGSTRK